MTLSQFYDGFLCLFYFSMCFVLIIVVIVAYYFPVAFGKSVILGNRC